MNQALNELRSLLRIGGLQQEYLQSLKKHPLLHFSEHAALIAHEGFLFGEPALYSLDFTDNKKRLSEGKPGYNFAFSTLHWDTENDCFDFEIADKAAELGLSGMVADRALLFCSDAVYTQHYDEFKQAVFWGPDADVTQALILERIEKEAGSSRKDKACWTARTGEGVIIVKEEDRMSLRLCVVKSLQFLDHNKGLSRKSSTCFRELYQEEIEHLDGQEENALPGRLPDEKTELKFEI